MIREFCSIGRSRYNFSDSVIRFVGIGRITFIVMEKFGIVSERMRKDLQTIPPNNTNAPHVPIAEKDCINMGWGALRRSLDENECFQLKIKSNLLYNLRH